MTKHRMIYETVQERIQSGAFRPGDRIPSDAELVREFSVSRPTVARALQELERAGLVRRRPGSGTYVQKVESEGKLFGLLIPRLGETEIFTPICSQMARMAQARNDAILWGASVSSTGDAGDRDKGELALELCRQYVRQAVGGVFFSPLELSQMKDEINREIVDSLSRAGIPVVLLDRDYMPYPNRSKYDLVGIDNRRAGNMITSHLLERGCRRILFLARPLSADTIDLRICGFADAIRQAGREYSVSMIHRCEPRDEAYVARMIRETEPDGIVCGNDVTAAHLMHSLDAIGISVPADVMVAGIDDVRYAELLRVPLTTIHQPCAAIGAAAFNAMLDRIETPDAPAREILLSCELVVRDSTGGQKVKEGT